MTADVGDAAAMGDGAGYLPDALTDDGLHPNARGYARMADAVRASLGTGFGT